MDISELPRPVTLCIALAVATLATGCGVRTVRYESPDGEHVAICEGRKSEGLKPDTARIILRKRGSPVANVVFYGAALVDHETNTVARPGIRWLDNSRLEIRGGPWWRGYIRCDRKFDGVQLVCVD